MTSIAVMKTCLFATPKPSKIKFLKPGQMWASSGEAVLAQTVTFIGLGTIKTGVGVWLAMMGSQGSAKKRLMPNGPIARWSVVERPAHAKNPQTPHHLSRAKESALLTTDQISPVSVFARRIG